ncbi:MAG: hypothetical protein R3272_16105 [Candidatus Promineifilaceae bacterium]|nr:hypothetical protein [Candidatus Promineifilaceae bacterium]
MRKRRLLLAGAAAILAVGLGAVLLGTAQQQAQAADPVSGQHPFHMSTYEVVTSQAPSAECPFLHVQVEGQGTATHLGKVTVTRDHCFSPTNNPPIYNGSWEAVAANGDTIWGSYEGSLTPTAFDENNNPIRGAITAPFTIDGGSGRFEGATGAGTIVAEDYDLITNEADFESEGWIEYSAK